MMMHEINGFDDAALGVKQEAGIAYDADGHVRVTSGPARRYQGRALLAGDIVCATQDIDLGHLPFLKSVGLAPNQVIVVPHNYMFRGLKNEPALTKELRSRFDQGAGAWFFRTTAQEEEFVAAMGLDWGRIYSSPAELGDIFSDKGYFRRCMRSLRQEHHLPPHAILNKGHALAQAYQVAETVRAMSQSIGFSQVLFKRTNLVSGGGFCMYNDPALPHFLQSNRNHDLIVETAVLPHDSVSIHWSLQNGRAVCIGCSKLLRDGFVHKGGVISSGDTVVAPEIKAKLTSMTAAYANMAAKVGCNGVLCCDAVLDQSGNHLYLTEADVRVAATSYLFNIARRLKAPWSVAGRIITEPADELKKYSDLEDRLNGLLYDPAKGYGALTCMIDGLRLPSAQRRVGLVSIAPNAQDAEAILDQGGSLLTA
ncbi:hypothetical protein GF391_04310 [Candidatus Uhrbacteria bacterium]|nr:hypothetical protein [Candidatus Uhrbacteria bacterium]